MCDFQVSSILKVLSWKQEIRELFILWVRWYQIILQGCFIAFWFLVFFEDRHFPRELVTDISAIQQILPVSSLGVGTDWISLLSLKLQMTMKLALINERWTKETGAISTWPFLNAPVSGSLCCVFPHCLLVVSENCSWWSLSGTLSEDNKDRSSHLTCTEHIAWARNKYLF